MNKDSQFQSISFDRTLQRVPRRAPIVMIPIILIILAWRFFPVNAFFWLSLMGVAILAWVASFGWRLALSNLINFLIDLTMK